MSSIPTERKLKMFEERARIAEDALRFLRDAMPYNWADKGCLARHIKVAQEQIEKVVQQVEKEFPQQ